MKWAKDILEVDIGFSDHLMAFGGFHVSSFTL